MEQPSARTAGRKRGLLILGIVVAILGLGWFGWWLLIARHYESTDDAYVSSDLVQVTSELPGTVLALAVDDTQSVERGDVLVELDPADANIGMGAAEAQLARAVRSVRGLFAQRDQLRAQAAQRTADLERASSDLARRSGLLGDGAVSEEELAHARDAVATARAALDAARQQLNATEAQIDGTTIATHPQVLDAEAAVRSAALALRRMQLRAPVSGVVAKRTVQVGQRIAAGAPLMAIVPLQSAWVDANFKEGQLRRMRVGQPVTLHADLYGGSVDFHGRVAGLPAGSGSAFALLPAQNASGNWIKIVQRVPVRIALDPKELAAHPLRIGLSMSVEVDVREASGSLMAQPARAAGAQDGAQPARDASGDDPQVTQRIAAIIRNNLGAQRTGG